MLLKMVYMKEGNCAWCKSFHKKFKSAYSFNNLKNPSKKLRENTIEALNAGFVWGYEGLINNIIDKIISRSKIKYKILLTGGYANFFVKL